MAGKRSKAVDRLRSPFLDEQMFGPAFEQVLPEPKRGNLAVPALAALSKLQAVDTRGKPLAGQAWQLHQGSKRIGGKLDAEGFTASLGTADLPFDKAQPFVLHVPGVVLCIAGGAVLVTDAPDVEYGGSLVDWRLAGAADSRVSSAFWSEYEQARRSDKGPGAVHFLAHDHIVRRPVRLLGAQAVFEARQPGVHLGPVVRYTDDHQALIWFELKAPMLVRVVYGRAPNQGRRPNNTDAPAKTLSRHACSVRIGGRHYAMVVLDGLDADTVVQYRVEFGNQPPIGALPVHEAAFTDAVFPKHVNPDRTLVNTAFDDSSWFFLRTMPRRSDDLRFAHGSCRKWPQNRGEGIEPGRDALEAFGAQWLKDRAWAQWPRFFVHTGDQIYADDLDHALATTLAQQRRAAVLPGPPPKAARDLAFGAWAGRFGWRYATKEPAEADSVEALKKLRPRTTERKDEEHDLDAAISRATKAQTQQATLAAALKPLQPMLPEPMRSKLRVLNRLLWEVPVDPKDVPRIDAGRRLLAGARYQFRGPSPRPFDIAYPSAGDSYAVHAADFAEYAALYEQAWGTPGTRRALAHVPSYMIFDDHEVADDWNADRNWVDTVHTTRDPLAMWPMTITDALAAYWVYQGWGNVAPQQAADDPRVKIIRTAQQQGRDALPELRRLLHERSVQPSVPASQRLHWNYAVPTGGPPMLVVDLRTDRDARGNGGMSAARLAWLERELQATRSAAAFIVLPVPFLMPDPLLFVFRHPRFTAVLAGDKSTAAFKRGSDIEHPAGDETWNQIKALLERLQRSHRTLKTLVIVSGDIHFSCNLDAQLPGAKQGPRLLQLVSSGLRQRVSDSKQDKLASAYRGWLNTIGGAEGVDKHRGLVLTLGGLSGPGGKLDNFVFTPSFAMVEMKTVPQGAARTPVPLIEQHSVTLDKDGKPEVWSMRHMTQTDGSAVMSLKDPGFRHPSMPSAYPHATGGIGIVKEDPVAEAAAEPLFEIDHLADNSEDTLETVELEADEAGVEHSEADEEAVLPFEQLEAIDATETVQLEEKDSLYTEPEREPDTEDLAWDDRSTAT
jgi:PhoD-like phosphatase